MQPLGGQQACRACTTGHYRVTASLEDACPLGFRCANCELTACTGDTYQDKAQQTTCEQRSMCGAGEFVAAAHTQTSDTQCAVCTSGFRSEAAHLQTECAEWTKCVAGEYVQTAGTVSSDRVCGACTSGFTLTVRCEAVEPASKSTAFACLHLCVCACVSVCVCVSVS